MVLKSKQIKTTKTFVVDLFSFSYTTTLELQASCTNNI